MVKKIKIFETKLEQFVGEGFAADDLKVVTKEIEFEASIELTRHSNKSGQDVKKITRGNLDQNKKEVLSLNKKILLQPSEGSGAEAMKQVKRIIDWMNKARYVSLDVTENLNRDASDTSNVEYDCVITGRTLTEVINSFCSCLRYSFEMLEDAYLLETAVQKVLDSGLRTTEFIQQGKTTVSYEQMVTAVITELKLIEQGFCLE